MKTQLLQSCPSQPSPCPSQPSPCSSQPSPCPSQPFPCPSQPFQCPRQPSLRTRPTIPMPIPTIPITCRLFIVVSILSARVEGNFLGNCFCTGASRTFFTAVGRFLFVVSSDVMLCMTVGVVMMAPRKTCFSGCHRRHGHYGGAIRRRHGFLCHSFPAHAKIYGYREPEYFHT